MLRIGGDIPLGAVMHDNPAMAKRQPGPIDDGYPSVNVDEMTMAPGRHPPLDVRAIEVSSFDEDGEDQWP